jgi:hypothetical protein
VPIRAISLLDDGLQHTTLRGFELHSSAVVPVHLTRHIFPYKPSQSHLAVGFTTVSTFLTSPKLQQQRASPGSANHNSSTPSQARDVLLLLLLLLLLHRQAAIWHSHISAAQWRARAGSY